MRFSAAIRVPPNPFRVPAAPRRPETLTDAAPEPVTAQATLPPSEPAAPADLDQRVRQSGEW